MNDMDWDRTVLDAIRETADEWENDPGDWRAVLSLYDRTEGEERRALEAALLRMIDQDYRNPHSKRPEETPWGGLGVSLPAGMQPEDLICTEAAVLTCAARGIDGAFFPFQRLMGAPRWHAMMPNLRWLQAELGYVQQRLSLTRPGRTLGAMVCLAAGDALGATLEFGPRRSRAGWHTEMTGGGPFGWAPGQWTDDTDMTLAVAEGIAAAPDDPVPAVGERFMAWYATDPRDVGNTVRMALEEFRRTGEWEQAAKAVADRLGARAAGNGALMRTLPVGLAYNERDDISRHALEIGHMTHPNAESDAACILYSLAVSSLADGLPKEQAWAQAAESTAWVPDRLRRPQDLRYEDLKSTGYVVDTLEAAAWCLLRTDSAAEALLHAVNLGGDSDTVGAVAGGLAGAAYGAASLPRRWSLALQGRDRLTTAAESLWRVYQGVRRR